MTYEEQEAISGAVNDQPVVPDRVPMLLPLY